MPNTIKDLHEVHHDAENKLIFETNCSIPIKGTDLPVRCNVYRPDDSDSKKYPVLATYGPYGKDIWYGDFHPKSYSELPEEHKSKYAAWETPEPIFWTHRGYVIVRADERGLGQSPGILDTMSKGTSECFVDVIEWAASQQWSNGKVGLLGVSYYAGSQWRVAARRPKGLAAIVPWEGMSDYYRDRCRHGGIFSNNFINFWWNRQVVSNQYGKPGRAAANWGEDTIEGSLEAGELLLNRRDQNIDNEGAHFRDDEYYSSKEFRLEDIEVPVLSVANWGGISLHLRGNVVGYTFAGSKFKWLRFITGRHDLPFYYPEEVEVQRSFLDAFLKNEDRAGWKTGGVAPVDLCLRKGNVGYNNPEGEKTFLRRQEQCWPIPATEYRTYYANKDQTLATTLGSEEGELSYKALGSVGNPASLQFTTPAFDEETEITGHVVAHLNLSMTTADQLDNTGKDIDVFVTLRHLSPAGDEVYYTGSSGDNVPLTKGWLRLSLRKVDSQHPRHRPYLPYRGYLSTDVQMLENRQIYGVDVELWPTNVVLDKGAKLVFEVSSGDTQGCGLFQHTSSADRPQAVFAGQNSLHFSDEHVNYVQLPLVPQK